MPKAGRSIVENPGVCSRRSRRGVVYSGQGIRVVGLDADAYAVVEENLDPDAESDHERHHYGVGLPVGAIDAHDFDAGSDNLGGAWDRRPVLAADVADDARVPAHSFYFVGIAGSEEFDLALADGEPDADLFQFAGLLIGTEPLGVALQSVL